MIGLNRYINISHNDHILAKQISGENISPWIVKEIPTEKKSSTNNEDCYIIKYKLFEEYTENDDQRPSLNPKGPTN
jgi:hypothetical protein